MLEAPNLPSETFEALRNYVENHRAPGGFLRAVLSNDLMEAVAQANCESLDALPEICGYVFSELPGDCWGSPEAVEAWVSVPNGNRHPLHLVS